MKTVRHSNLLMQECYYSVAINKGSWKCYMYHMIISTDNKLKWVHKPGINDVSSDEKTYCLLSKPCWVVLYVKQVKKFELCLPILSLLSFLNHVHDELWCLLCVWREKCSPASVLLPEQLYIQYISFEWCCVQFVELETGAGLLEGTFSHNAY